MLGYAITIHKSQGMTLDKAIIDIGDSERSLGLTYVGFSRVTKLEGIMIEKIFTKQRLDAIATSRSFQLRKTFMENLAAINNNP